MSSFVQTDIGQILNILANDLNRFEELGFLLVYIYAAHWDPASHSGSRTNIWAAPVWLASSSSFSSSLSREEWVDSSIVFVVQRPRSRTRGST